MVLAFGGFWQSMGSLALPRRKSSGIPTKVNLHVAHTVPWWVRQGKQKWNRVKCLWPKKCKRSHCLVLLRKAGGRKEKSKPHVTNVSLFSGLRMFCLFWGNAIKNYRINIMLIYFFDFCLRSPGVGLWMDAALNLQKSYFSMISFDDSRHSLTHRWFPCPPDSQIYLSPGNFA